MHRGASLQCCVPALHSLGEASANERDACLQAAHSHVLSQRWRAELPAPESVQALCRLSTYYGDIEIYGRITIYNMREGLTFDLPHYSANLRLYNRVLPRREQEAALRVRPGL